MPGRCTREQERTLFGDTWKARARAVFLCLRLQDKTGHDLVDNSCSHIVRLVKTHEDDEEFYHLYQDCKQGPVQAYLAASPELRESTAAELITGVLLGLKDCHERGQTRLLCLLNISTQYICQLHQLSSIKSGFEGMSVLQALYIVPLHHPLSSSMTIRPRLPILGAV